jgi:integrase
LIRPWKLITGLGKPTRLHVGDTDDEHAVVGKKLAVDRLGEAQVVENTPEAGRVVHRGDLDLLLLGGLAHTRCVDPRGGGHEQAPTRRYQSVVEDGGEGAAARPGRSWVAVPEWLLVEIADTCPREDRTPERRVFQGFSPNSAKAAMTRACKAAGIVHRHPHDLRHRYASVKIAEGVPVTVVAAQLGHSRNSLTLDTYSHVLLDEGR